MRWIGPHHKIEFACYQHDGSDRQSKHPKHYIVWLIHCFRNLWFLFEPRREPRRIRSTARTCDGDKDAYLLKLPAPAPLRTAWSALVMREVIT